MNDECAVALATGLGKGSAPLLTSIDLCSNRIGVDGATALLKALGARGKMTPPPAHYIRVKIRNNNFCNWASIEESQAFRKKVIGKNAETMPAAWCFAGNIDFQPGTPAPEALKILENERHSAWRMPEGEPWDQAA